MHRHSRDVCTNGSWSCRGCIDCSDLQIIALKSDQQQPTKVKTSPTNRSPAALPWEATCLIVCGVLRPLLQRALGEKGKSGPDLSLPLPASFTHRLGNVSVLLTSTLLQLPDTNKIGALINCNRNTVSFGDYEVYKVYALNSTKVTQIHNEWGILYFWLYMLSWQKWCLYY